MATSWMSFLLVLTVVGCRADIPLYTYETNLVTSLLQDYVTEVKPSSAAVSILLRPDAVSIGDIDESVDVLKTTMLIKQSWYDPRLAWNPATNGNISGTRIPLDAIWKPDLQLFNIFKDNPGPLYEGYAYVLSNGTVLVYPVWTLYSYCPLDLTFFPFDTQTCTLTFGSSTRDVTSMTLRLTDALQENVTSLSLKDTTNDEFNTHIDVHPSWKILDIKMSLRTQAFTFSDAPSMLADLTFTLKRQSGFLRYIMVVPSVMLSVLIPIQFLLPSTSAQRTPYSLLLIACYVTLMTTLQLSSPFVHSSISRIGLFHVVSVVFAVVAAILSSLTTSISTRGKRRRSVPYWLNQILMFNWVRRILCMGESPHISNLYKSVNTQIYGRDVDTDHSQSDGQDGSSAGEHASSGPGAYIRATARSMSAIAGQAQERTAVEKVKVEWDDACRALDRLCFVIFTFMAMVAIISLIVAFDK